jgi:thymidylate synthase (FAD)
MTCRECEDGYKEMSVFGSSPQIARAVLPNCLKTEIIMTSNFREWRHFLKLRTSKAAHPQIREVAGYILDWFKTHYPVIVEDINEQ